MHPSGSVDALLQETLDTRDVVTQMVSGKFGLKVSPKRGRALLFYNLRFTDGEPDPAAVHAALPLVGNAEKWVANFWIADHSDHGEQ